MKMYLISDNVDTYTGMRLAGVDGVVVHEKQELRDALETAMNDKSIGIILLTERFGREFPDLIDEIKFKKKDASSDRNSGQTRNRTLKRISLPHTSMKRLD